MALKVGIVGMRGIGPAHAMAYGADPLAELVGICDLIPERAEAAAEKYGCKPYTSLDAMLAAEPDLDIVDIVTGGPEAGGWHYEPAMAAMAAGKHVLVEKPLSNDVELAREMVAEANRRGVYLACNLNHYFTPPADKGKQYLDEGGIGEIVYALAKIGFQGGEPETIGPSKPVGAGYPYFHLKAFLSHPLSCLRYFCGDVVEVQAFIGKPGFRRVAGDPVLSTVSIHLRFANDAVGYLLSQRGNASYGLGGWWSLEVGGTRGTFCIENCIERITYWKAHDPRTQGKPVDQPPTEVTPSGTVDFEETFPLRLHAFLEDITNGVPRDRLRGSGRDALAALEYTYAIIESYEQGGALVRPHRLPVG